MARKLKADMLLVWATLALLVVSLAWVYSASALREFRAGNDPGYAVAKQAVWAMFGLACLLVATRVDYRFYKKRPVLIGMMAATLLGLVAVYLFKPVKGAH